MAVILRVIRHHSDNASFAAADIAFSAGCSGVFLIRMGGREAMLGAPVGAIKARWTNKFVGRGPVPPPGAADATHGRQTQNERLPTPKAWIPSTAGI